MPSPRRDRKKKSLDLGISSAPHPVPGVMKSSPPIRSGELARLALVSRDTLRYYERHGLLQKPLRSQAGYRLYDAEALGRVRLIRGALALGFRIDELARILKQRDHGQPPCREVCELAAGKIAELGERIDELCELKRLLEAELRSWKRQVARSGNGQAKLLEGFIAKHPERAATTSPQLAPGLQRKFQKREAKP